MAKTFTNDEKREIEEKAKYILTAMDDIGKNGGDVAGALCCFQRKDNIPAENVRIGFECRSETFPFAQIAPENNRQIA